MRIIARKTLKQFWKRHADSEQPLKAWFAEVSQVEWKSMATIKERFPHASIVNGERVAFNIGGNKYRLVVKVWLAGQAVWIKFIGTHRQYEKIDVSTL
jgi:mRNA interferase HigB